VNYSHVSRTTFRATQPKGFARLRETDQGLRGRRNLQGLIEETNEGRGRPTLENAEGLRRNALEAFELWERRTGHVPLDAQPKAAVRVPGDFPFSLEGDTAFEVTADKGVVQLTTRGHCGRAQRDELPTRLLGYLGVGENRGLSVEVPRDDPGNGQGTEEA
jgi:hypothetical protein